MREGIKKEIIIVGCLRYTHHGTKISCLSHQLSVTDMTAPILERSDNCVSERINDIHPGANLEFKPRFSPDSPGPVLT